MHFDNKFIKNLNICFIEASNQTSKRQSREAPNISTEHKNKTKKSNNMIKKVTINFSN